MNFDHGAEATCYAWIESGFYSSVMIDVSHEPFEENVDSGAPRVLDRIPHAAHWAQAGEMEIFVSDEDKVLLDDSLTSASGARTRSERLAEFEFSGSAAKYFLLFFDPAKTSCAIVTCGGLCPGINDVIRGLTMQAYIRYSGMNIMCRLAVAGRKQVDPKGDLWHTLIECNRPVTKVFLAEASLTTCRQLDCPEVLRRHRGPTSMIVFHPR